MTAQDEPIEPIEPEDIEPDPEEDEEPYEAIDTLAALQDTDEAPDFDPEPEE